ncbi:MAG: hypothetical protein ACOY3Y_03165, partial [Acidobacteriota bacterium]
MVGSSRADHETASVEPGQDLLIVGFGNDLAGDDGVGLEVVRLLRRWRGRPESASRRAGAIRFASLG